MKNHPPMPVFDRLKSEVIDAGLCTHCGTCVGVADGLLEMRSGSRGPVPTAVSPAQIELDPIVYEACPGKGINYPEVHQEVFGELPRNWLIGHYRTLSVGYSCDDEVRSRGASGGVITQTLIYLLESGRIDGAVVLVQGRPRPWLAQPAIAVSREEILAASQSVYVPMPVNTILSDMESFDGRLAYVGLPDQVASLRQLQRTGHQGAQKVDYVIGPYFGTSMYIEAIESYLRSNGVDDLEDVTELKYREGDWPGHLAIRTRTGKELRAEKFYYNYLIPFYITRSCLLTPDFTNELTDISVGDAWHPRYRNKGGGFSVVIGRSESGETLLTTMEREDVVALETTTTEDLLSMHAHMIDFKKRGAFIRLRWRALCGETVPDYGYQPMAIPLSRKLVELVIVLLFGLGGTSFCRALVELVPQSVIGPIFEKLRMAWKQVSKPTKRSGLLTTRYERS